MDTLTRISTAIHPHRTNTQGPPPFTTADLVVIALALSDRPLTDCEIGLWIWRAFPFYAAVGLPAAWGYLDVEHAGNGRREGGRGLLGLEGEVEWARGSETEVAGGLRGVLARWDVPVSAVEGSDGDGEGDATTRWTVDLAHAALFLRPRLWPDEQPADPFPFLQLPPEIRNIIYTMAFAFPSSGIMINRHEMDRTGGVHAVSRSFERAFDFEPWKYSGRHLHAGRVSEIMGLTAVNRQIRSETLHVFAAVNTFYFSSPAHMLAVLRNMSRGQRNSIRTVAFHHRPGASKQCALVRAFGWLSQMKRLTALRIHIDQEDFRRYYRSRPLIEPIQWMGFDRAPRIGGAVTVLLEGDYPPEIERQIRSGPVEQRAPLAKKLEQNDIPRPLVSRWSAIAGGFSVRAIVYLTLAMMVCCEGLLYIALAGILIMLIA